MTSLKHAPRWAITCFLLALALRVGLVVVQSQFHIFDVVYDASDSVLYRGLAESLIEDGRYWFNDHPTAYVTPGYPLFLAALFFVGRSTLFIGLVQSIIGALTVLLIADCARRLSGVRAAWIAGLTAAVYPHFLFWTGYVLTETFYLFAFALGTWLMVLLISTRDPRPWLSISAGAVWGLAILTRPNTLGFVLLLIIVGLLSHTWRRIAFLSLVGFAALWIPWVIRNAIALDAFVPTSTESGVILYQGNSAGATGGTRGYVDALDFQPLPRAEGLGEVEQERVYREAALDWMSRHPGGVLALAPKKLANMFRPTYAGSSTRNTLVTLLTYPLLLLAGSLGLVLLWRRGELAGRLLVLLVAYHLMVHGLLTGMIRFRLPVELILCASAACAGAWLLSRRERRAL